MKKKEPINILSTRQVEGSYLPWTFTLNDRRQQITEFGRYGNHKNGFSILARLVEGAVVELQFDNIANSWFVIAIYKGSQHA